VKLLRIIEVEDKLKREKKERVVNIQPLTVRLLLHSSSSSECAEGKVYNENIQFAHTIIQDIYTTGTLTIEFLRRSR